MGEILAAAFGLAGLVWVGLGPAAEPHLKTMRRGAYAFLGLMGVVVVVAVISIIVNASSSTPS
jgi:hypothetical protein